MSKEIFATELFSLLNQIGQDRTPAQDKDFQKQVQNKLNKLNDKPHVEKQWIVGNVQSNYNENQIGEINHWLRRRLDTPIRF